jgi:cyclic pyranopterin phosphate synthase
MKKLSHTDSKGKAKMVDVSHKKQTYRTAEATGRVFVSSKVFNAIKHNEIEKGDVITVARVAGIQAAKRTSESIPLCHNIMISGAELYATLNEKDLSLDLKSIVKTHSITGVEMEALNAVAIAALTVYDMCKALDKSIRITDIQLISKTGGKSGVFRRKIVDE